MLHPLKNGGLQVRFISKLPGGPYFQRRWLLVSGSRVDPFRAMGNTNIHRSPMTRSHPIWRDHLSLGILAHRTSDDDQGVYNHLQNARDLGSMKPFSEGDWIPRVLINFFLC